MEEKDLYKIKMNLRPVAVIFVVLTCASCLRASEEKTTDMGTKKLVRYCQSQTPCGWRIYNHADYSEISLTNNYCVCKPGQKCQFHESRINEGYMELRCKQYRP